MTHCIFNEKTPSLHGLQSDDYYAIQFSMGFLQGISFSWFTTPEVGLQNAPYLYFKRTSAKYFRKNNRPVLWRLSTVQPCLDQGGPRSPDYGLLRTTYLMGKMIRTLWRSPSPGLSTNWIKIIKLTFQFELQILKSIPSADQIANVICRRKFREFCQFFQNFPAKELILNSLSFFRRYIWAFFHYWNSFI